MKNKGRIIVTEDDKNIRELMKLFLNSYFPNYELEIYKDGHSLKKTLNSNPKGIELILLDNDVPDKSLGLEITRDYSLKINAPIVIISGYPIDKEAEQAGAYAFVKKPFTMNELSEVIKKGLNHKKELFTSL